MSTQPDCPRDGMPNGSSLRMVRRRNISGSHLTLSGRLRASRQKARQGIQFPGEESLPVLKQVAIVIEILNIELETTFADALRQIIRNAVLLLWNDLKGSPDVILFVQIHQPWNEINSALRFDVVGHHDATGRERRAGGLRRDRHRSLQFRL